MHFASDGGIWKPSGSEKSMIGGAGIACADTVGATAKMASTVKPAFESNENVLESFIWLTFPPCYFICVRRAINVTLSSVPKIGITQKTFWRMWQEFGVSCTTSRGEKKTCGSWLLLTTSYPQCFAVRRYRQAKCQAFPQAS